MQITAFEQNLLFKQSQLNKLEDNTYLTDTSNENYKYIAKKFFSWYKESEIKLLNTWSSLFSIISNIISSFVWEPDNIEGVNFQNFTKDYTALWYCCIGLKRPQGSPLHIEYLPAKYYFNHDWKDKIMRIYIKEKKWMTAVVDYDTYAFIKTYEVGYTLNQLYKLPVGFSGESIFTNMDKVELTELQETENLVEKELTWLDTKAIFVIKQDPNEQYPKSMFEIIQNLVYSIDRKIMVLDTQYLQNVESFILTKNIIRPQKLLKAYNEGRKLDFSEVWKIVNWQADSSIEFISNKNELIDKAIETSKDQIKTISSLTTIPVDFLWFDSTGGAVGFDSRALKYSWLQKTVQSIRDMYDTYLPIIFEMIEKEDKEFDSTYSRPDIFEKDTKALAEELTIARTQNLVSQFKAIKRYNDYSDEETMEEVEKIKGETKEAMDILKTNEINDGKDSIDWWAGEDEEDSTTDDGSDTMTA